MNLSDLNDLTSANEVSIVPMPAYLQINEISPTTNNPVQLQYGAYTGTYDQYCLLENNTSVAGCSWVAGTLPTNFAVATTEGSVRMSMWLMDSSGTVSSRLDSNTVTVDRVAPQIASITVTNTTPTNQTTYALTYGVVTGTYNQYCILENDTNVANCTWSSATLPSVKTVSATENDKTLSLWIRDAAGNTSTRRDSNVVTLDTTAPTIALQSLTGGQTIGGGVDTTITWTGSDLHPGATPIRIERSADSGATWSVLSAAEANDGSYTWSVPAVNSTTNRIRLTFTDEAGNSATSASTSDFTVSNFTPVVTVTSPNGGEVWKGNEARNITWTSTGLPPGASTAVISYSTNGGTSWTDLATGIVNGASNTQSVTLPNLDAAAVLIRVSVTDVLSSVTTDVSDSSFKLDITAPALSLTSPVGAEAWAGGQSVSVAWTASDANFAAGPITLEYSTNSGTSWTAIASNIANSSPYSWTAPSINSTTVRVRAVATDLAGHVSTSATSSNSSIDSTAPTLASVTITNSNPTNSTTYGLSYGAVGGGGYASYCILENDTTLSNCTFTAGTLPASFVVDSTNESKTLSVWIRDSVGNTSSRVDSQAVAYDNVAPTMTAATILNVSPSASRGYLLSYTGLSETIGSYCVLENDATIGNCSWTASSSPPASYTVSATMNAKVLSIWVRDPAGNTSSRYDTNSVTYSNLIAISPVSATISQTYSVDIVDGKRLGAQSVTLNDGRVLFIGGCYEGTNQKTYYRTVKAYDPSTGKIRLMKPMMIGRCYHQALKLSDGRVIVIGGMSAASAATNSVEIYDPTANQWIRMGNMGSTRAYHTATLLTNGKILVAGGHNGSAATTRNTTELYDVANNVWLAGPNMSANRFSHQAALLSSDRVVLMGGLNNTTFLSSVDLFTTAGHTGTIAAKTAMASARAEFTAFSLANTAESGLAAGEGVVVIGGRSASSTYLNTIAVFDPAASSGAGSWTTQTQTLSKARAQHWGVKYSDGRILILGGRDSSGTPPVEVQIYQTWNDTFVTSPAPVSIAIGRPWLTAALLNDGDRVVVGYGDTDHNYAYTLRSFRKSTGTWTQLHWLNYGWDQSPGRSIALSDGRGFTCFGRDSSAGYEPETCAVFEPTLHGTWYTADMNDHRTLGDIVELPSGKILVTGGLKNGFATAMDYSEIYDFTTDSWSSTANQPEYFGIANAVLIPSTNKVLVVADTSCGGNNCASAQGKSYVYDVAANTWAGSYNLPTAQQEGRLIATSGGRILYLGGINGATHRNTIYEFNSTTNTWSNPATNTMTVGRRNFAHGEANGAIYVLGGGADGSTITGTLEKYDLATDTWSSVGTSSYTGWWYTCGLHAVNNSFIIRANNKVKRVSLTDATTTDLATMDTWATGPCATLADGRVLLHTEGKADQQIIVNIGTPQTFTATGGDGDYTWTHATGTNGTFYPDARLFVPLSTLPAGVSTIQVQEGGGQSATSTLTKP